MLPCSGNVNAVLIVYATLSLLFRDQIHSYIYYMEAMVLALIMGVLTWRSKLPAERRDYAYLAPRATIFSQRTHMHATESRCARELITSSTCHHAIKGSLVFLSPLYDKSSRPNGPTALYEDTVLDLLCIHWRIE